MEYRSIADLNQTIRDNLYKIPRDIDLVVGIPRSGLLAANMLALHRNLPLTDVRGLIEGSVMHGGRRRKRHAPETEHKRQLRVLVLDDSIYSGQQMREIKREIQAARLPHELLFAVVYAAPQSAQDVDIYLEMLPTPRRFEWNIMHHSNLQVSCMDIDGVLCRDPTEQENDDGPRYAEFLRNVEPILIPTVPIGWLVTCRLEKYRPLTEQWLAKHGIEYRQLIMMDLPSKAARIAAASHSKFKSDVYIKTNAVLFVESSLRQSREISTLTGKPVFCLETWRMEHGCSGESALGRVECMSLRLQRTVRRICGKLSCLSQQYFHRHPLDSSRRAAPQAAAEPPTERIRASSRTVEPSMLPPPPYSHKKPTVSSGAPQTTQSQRAHQCASLQQREDAHLAAPAGTARSDVTQ